MATELDLSESRRFDIAMSRRTRRSASLASCFQDEYVPSLAQHRHQELKVFLQCQDEELKALQQSENAGGKASRLHEDEDLKIVQAPLQCEDDEQKTPDQYEDEQEKESQQYSDQEQNKGELYLHEEEKPEQYQDEDESPSQKQDEELVTPNQPEEDEEEATRERFQDVEQKKLQQQQEEDEQVPEQSEEDEQEQHKSQTEQFPAVKKLATPPRVVDNVPRFSLQELIKQKQLPTDEAKPTNNMLGSHGESVLADRGVSGSGVAAGGTTLAMVIKRPEGGKKPMGMIRRCVKALNQMIKAKQGSKKNLHF